MLILREIFGKKRISLKGKFKAVFIFEKVSQRILEISSWWRNIVTVYMTKRKTPESLA